MKKLTFILLALFVGVTTMATEVTDNLTAEQSTATITVSANSPYAHVVITSPRIVGPSSVVSLEVPVGTNVSFEILYLKDGQYVSAEEAGHYLDFWYGPGYAIESERVTFKVEKDVEIRASII